MLQPWQWKSSGRKYCISFSLSEPFSTDHPIAPRLRIHPLSRYMNYRPSQMQQSTKTTQERGENASTTSFHEKRPTYDKTCQMLSALSAYPNCENFETQAEEKTNMNPQLSRSQENYQTTMPILLETWQTGGQNKKKAEQFVKHDIRSRWREEC